MGSSDPRLDEVRRKNRPRSGLDTRTPDGISENPCVFAPLSRRRGSQGQVAPLLSLDTWVANWPGTDLEHAWNQIDMARRTDDRDNDLSRNPCC